MSFRSHDSFPVLAVNLARVSHSQGFTGSNIENLGVSDRVAPRFSRKI
jgi:hypothetical protein